MARKDNKGFNDFNTKSMGFENVVSNNEKKETVEAGNQNEEQNNNQQELLDDILGADKERKVNRAIYIDKHINDVINEATKDKPHGSISKLINIALEKGLKELGLL